MTRKDGPLLSSVQTCKGSSLSKREIEKANKGLGVKCTINCQRANSLQKVVENLSTQRRNEPKSDQGTPLRTGLLRLLDSLRNYWVIRFWNHPRKDSNFEISHTFDRYCKNKTTTSLTAIDRISRQLIAGSKIAKFIIRQKHFIMPIRQILTLPNFPAIWYAHHDIHVLINVTFVFLAPVVCSKLLASIKPSFRFSLGMSTLDMLECASEAGF